MGILIEQFKGAFPYWISPVQVGIVPIRSEHNEYAKELADLFRKNKIRFEVDYSDNNMKEKIKKFKKERLPYVIIVGDKEAVEHTLSLNTRTGKNLYNVPVEKFIEMSNKMRDEKSLTLIDEI